MILAHGTLSGRGGHELHGSFVIEKRGGDLWFATDEAFYFDGSPEPAFAFATSPEQFAEQAQETRFLNLPGTGSLTGVQIKVRGKQEGRVGTLFDAASTHFVFLWCFMTPFLLGVGEIKLGEPV